MTGQAQTPSTRPFIASPFVLVLFALVAGFAAFVAFAAAMIIHQSSTTAETDIMRNAITVALLAGGFICFFVSAALLITGSVRWAMRGVSAPASTIDNGQIVDLLRSINDRVMISDNAKHIAYRAQDLKLLRDTIKNDMDKGDYDAAIVLVDDLNHVYGYAEEAEVLREQIAAARVAEIESKVDTAIERLDLILANKSFDQASREASKIQRLYGQSDRVRNLDERVIQAREQFKHELERQFLAAAEKDDVDQAMDLLKELDRYLTEQEAEPYRETARGVIGKKRDNLGVQFKIAVHDREWTRSVRVGEQIIQEFPNTRMSDEVRNLIDLLRERAAGQMAARPQQETPAT